MHRMCFGMLIGFAVLVGVASVPGEGRAADKWGLPDEEVVRFDAQVVDLLCELNGDCPANCGSGARQLALKTDDGNIVLPAKNVVPFAGTAAELVDFCGQRVTADGLLTTNRGATLFVLQFVRQAPDGKWRRANRFLSKWAKKNGVAPDSAQAKQWFRNDPAVKDLIDRQGKLGLGAP